MTASEQIAFRGKHVADDVASIIGETITREHMFDLFHRLHFPAPSGTELYTASPAIRALLENLQVPLNTFNANFQDLEFPALFAGEAPLDLLFVAHSDEISYIVTRSGGGLEIGQDNLVANFAHRPAQNISGSSVQAYPAAVVRWCGHEAGYRVVGTGKIHWTADDIRPWCSLDSLDGTPATGDRIVYEPPVVLDSETGLVTGKADDRAGMAACIAMCEALTKIARHLDLDPAAFMAGVIFPGQEEGTIGAGGDTEFAFARDSRAVGLSMAASSTLPRAWINIDGHEVDPLAPVGLYTCVVSEARGTVVPPHRLSPYSDFFNRLHHERGLNMAQTTELGGRVSRSDDNGVLGVIPKRAVPIGFSIRDPHYNGGLPTTNIDSVVQLTVALTWLAVAFRGVRRSGPHLELAD